MEIRHLVEASQAIDDLGVEYFGDPTAEFNGLEVRPYATPVRGRFHVVSDSTWPKKTHQRYGSPGGQVATRIERVSRAQVHGFVLSKGLMNDEVRSALEGKNYLLVNDSFQFFLSAAALLRDLNSESRLTAVTGSAGKTTTKAMIAHALEHIQAGPVLTTEGNENLYFQVLRFVTGMERYAHAVLEIAMGTCRFFRDHNHSNKADVAVVTSISEAHVAGLSSLADVALTKSNVFTSPPAGGTAVICADAPHAGLLMDVALRSGRQLITYGESQNAAVRLVEYAPRTQQVTAEVAGERLSYRLGAPGRHLAVNSLAVIAVLRAHGIKEWREGVRSLAKFAPVEGRGHVKIVELPDGTVFQVIDEAYNANPASVRAAIESLSNRTNEVDGRKVAILGDMLELGNHAGQAHRDLASSLDGALIDTLIIFGSEMLALHEELENRAIPHTYFPSRKDFESSIAALLKMNDLVLAKASKATGLRAWLSELPEKGR